MSESVQVPLGNNSSVGSEEVSKAAGSNGTEQPHKEAYSAGYGEKPVSTDAEQPRKDQVPRQAPKNVADNGSNVLHSIVGDNPQVNIYYFGDVIQGKRLKLAGSRDTDGVSNQNPDRTDELISEILRLERQDSAFFPGKESSVESSQLPETEEEFSE